MSIDVIREHAEIVIENTLAMKAEEWLAKRREGVGGSDAAAAVGLSPWDTQYSLWADKRGLVGPKKVTDPMKWGTRFEEPIGLGFAEDTGIAVTRYPVMLRSKLYPWAQVNLDFLTADASGVVECKNIGRDFEKEWDDGNVPDHLGLQGQHELAVTGLDYLWFAAVISGNVPRYIRVERNQSLIDDLMEQERVFWELVVANTPPAVDGSAATKRALAEQFAHPTKGGVEDVDTPVMRDLVERHLALKADEKYVEAALDTVDNQIRAILGNAEIGLVGDKPAVTWKSQPDTRISPDLLREKYPEIAAECSITKPVRKLLIPKHSPFRV